VAPLDEPRLALAAAEGDGAAFAALYDAYEARIFTFCQRIVGTPEDAADATQEAFLKVLQRLPSLSGRELNFGAYLFTAARNASYDVIGKRRKADAVGEIPEIGSTPVLGDERAAAAEHPEQAAMLGSLQVAVQAANARLPERQREVLALRELEELSYDDIAQIMDMNRNAVAQLISRARIKLRDELRGSALTSIAVSSEACERALPLISMRQDGQLSDEGDREWLRDHLAGCDTCRVSVDAMEEAGLSYRAWLPVVPVAWLWKSTMAKAAELTQSDWSDLIEGGRHNAPSAAAGDDRPPAGDGPGGNGSAPRRLRRLLLAGAGALLLALLLVALVTGDDDPPVVSAPAAETGLQPVATDEAVHAPKKGAKSVGKTPGEAASSETTTLTVPNETTPVVVGRKVRSRDRRKSGGSGSAPGDGDSVSDGIVVPPARGGDTTAAPPADEPAGTTTADSPPPATTTPPPTTAPPVDCRQNPTHPDCSRPPPSDGRCSSAPNDPDCPRPPGAGPTARKP
jgi:RNA polymerase sigma-70 factor (ECF subfamily)